MGPFDALAPVRTRDHQPRAERGEDGEPFAAEADADGDGPDRFRTEEQAGPAGGAALDGPGLGKEGEDAAEQGEVDQLGPCRGSRRGPAAGRSPATGTANSAEPTTVWTAVRCSGRTSRPAPVVSRPTSATCPARTTAAASISRSPVRGACSPLPAMSSPTASTHTAAAAKNLGGSPPRPLARSSSGVSTMVRLMIRPALAALVCATPYVSSRRTAAWVTPSTAAGADLVTAEGAEGTAYEHETDERGYRVPREQDHQDREGVGGRLRREVAGTPDDRDKQKYQVGTAGMRHSPYGAGRQR